MVYSKEIAIFAAKRIKLHENWSSPASFPLSASHSLLSVKFLLINRSN